MKTTISNILCLSIIAMALVGCTKEMDRNERIPSDCISFIASVEQTKTSVSMGKSTWNSGDCIGIFGFVGEGECTSRNIQYITNSNAASASFQPVSDGVTAADNYLAYYPFDESASDHSKITFSLPVDRKCTPGSSVSDIKCPLVGKSSGTDSKTGAVLLSFKPVLPILEFALTGQGQLASFEIELLGETSVNQETLGFLSASGSIDLSSGTLSCNELQSDSGKARIVFTDSEGKDAPVTLDSDKPVCIQVLTGRFVASDGWRLVFSYSNGSKVYKTIWQGKTPAVSMWDEKTGCCKHICQPVVVPYGVDMTRPMYICGDMNGWIQDKVDKMYPMFKDNSNADNNIYKYIGYMPAKTSYKFLPEANIGTYNAFCLYKDGSNRIILSDTGSSFWNEVAGYKEIEVNLGTMTYSVKDYDISAVSEWNTIGFIGTFNGWGTDWDMTKLSEENAHIWNGVFTVEKSAESYHCGKFRANDGWDNVWNNYIGFEWSTPFGRMTTSPKPDVNIYFGPEAATYQVIFNDVTGHYWVLRK